MDYENLILTPEECRVGGLPPDPEWEESEKGEGEKLLDALVRVSADSDQGKRLYEQRMKWKAVQEFRRNEWNRGFKELLKRHHDDLLTVLIEGRLRSQGQRSGLLTGEDIRAGASWQDIPWEAIPSKFWSSCKIDWEKCRAKDGAAAYNSIVVDTDDLFRAFPLPSPQAATGVSKSGDYFVLSDDVAGPTQKLGRPQEYPWDEFRLELARRAVKNQFPSKQEAFLADMQNWCRVPGDTSLKLKIAPYYQEFVRPKKGKK